MRVLGLLSVSAFLLCATMSVNAADTVQNFIADFPDTGPGGGEFPFDYISNNVPPTTDADGFLRMSRDGTGGTASFVAFDQAFTGGWSTLEIQFDMRISESFDGSSQGCGFGADGFGFAFASSADHGDSGPITWAVGEEPNLAGSFGVGFDTFDNGDEGCNSVSLHTDDLLWDNAPIDDSDIPTFETGDILNTTVLLENTSPTESSVTVVLTDGTDTIVPWASEPIDLGPIEGRLAFGARTGGAYADQDLANVRLSVDGTEVQNIQFPADFGGGVDPGDEPMLVGGTPYTVEQRGSDPAPLLRNQDGLAGVQDGYMRMTSEVDGQLNNVAFDRTSDAVGTITAEFDFRVHHQIDDVADGYAFLLLPTDQYGDDGGIGENVSEEPNLTGALGIGFDTFDNDEEGEVDDDGCGGGGACADRRANHISVHYDGLIIEPDDFTLGVILDRDELDLVGDEFHNIVVQIDEDPEGARVSVVITDGTDGSVHVPYADFVVPGMDMSQAYRAAFGARTGGASDFHELDSVNIRFGISTLGGDYNNDGNVDVLDIDLQSSAMKDPAPDAATLAIFDENTDGAINLDDRLIWIKDHRGTWVGDANLDGEFASSDLVAVFAAGKYETGEMAGWAEGDWNGDMGFGSSDLVFAFSDGGYEMGPLPATAAVPEPSSVVLLLLGSLMLLRRRLK